MTKEKCDKCNVEVEKCGMYAHRDGHACTARREVNEGVARAQRDLGAAYTAEYTWPASGKYDTAAVERLVAEKIISPTAYAVAVGSYSYGGYPRACTEYAHVVLVGRNAEEVHALRVRYTAEARKEGEKALRVQREQKRASQLALARAYLPAPVLAGEVEKFARGVDAGKSVDEAERVDEHVLGLHIVGYRTRTERADEPRYNYTLSVRDGGQYRIVHLWGAMGVADVFPRAVRVALRAGCAAEVRRQGDVYLLPAGADEEVTGEVERDAPLLRHERHVASQRLIMYPDGLREYVRGNVTHPEHPALDLGEKWYVVVGDAQD